MWFKFLFPVLMLMTISAWSAVVDLSSPALYDSRGNTKLYAQTISSIQPGDVVVFQDGARFTIDQELGRGTLAVIYSIRERPHQILRLALSFFTLSSLESTIQGYGQLKESNIRLVKIDPRSNKHYVLAEKISSDFITLEEMILGLQPRLKKEMLSAFWRFVQSIAPYKSIADLHEENVVYDRHSKEWILIDWMDRNKKIASVADVQNVSETISQLFGFLNEPDRVQVRITSDMRSEIKSLIKKTTELLKIEKKKYFESHGGSQSAVSCESLMTNILDAHF